MKQFVAETTVTLHRPAKKKKKKKKNRDGTTREVAGASLALRLIAAQVRDARGKTVATWMLLTNVDQADADAATIARWYYWRWRIESFFKILKSAGQQMEHWQQETGAAIARRLLVAAMACVTVWQLDRQASEPARKMKKLLVRFSSRPMKRSRPVTASALPAGLFVLLPLLYLLASHGGDLRDIQRLAEQALPMFFRRREV